MLVILIGLFAFVVVLGAGAVLHEAGEVVMALRRPRLAPVRVATASRRRPAAAVPARVAPARAVPSHRDYGALRSA